MLLLFANTSIFHTKASCSQIAVICSKHSSSNIELAYAPLFCRYNVAVKCATITPGQLSFPVLEKLLRKFLHSNLNNKGSCFSPSVSFKWYFSELLVALSYFSYERLDFSEYIEFPFDS